MKKQRKINSFAQDLLDLYDGNTSLVPGESEEIDTGDEKKSRKKKAVASNLESQEKAIETVLDELLSGDANIPRDIKTDDRDIPEFKNFYQACYNPLGLDTNPFGRQMSTALHLFAEFCPRCSNPRYINSPLDFPVDYKAKDIPEHLQLLENGECPKCGATKRQLMNTKKNEHPLRKYQELAALIGQRAGKSTMVAMLGSYVVARYLKMQNIHQVYGLEPGPISFTLVALTYDKSSELLWLPLKTRIENSPWFQEYHKLLDFYGNKYSSEQYKFMDSFLHYKHRSMIINPSGPNKRTLRGSTRAWSVIDELGWFDNSAESSSKVMISANEIYTALDRSLLTIRAAWINRLKEGYNNLLTGYACNISSPSSFNDKICTLVRENEHSKTVLALQIPTWDFNPKITKKMLKNEFRTNPATAERDYGANPPMGDNPFFDNNDAVLKSFSVKQNWAKYRYVVKTSKSGRVQRYAKFVNLGMGGISNMPPTVLSIDAGYSNNSFGLSIGHLDEKKLKFPFLMEIAPGKSITLNYSLIFNHVICPIIEAYNVKVFLADRWQSLKLLSDVEEKYGIYAEQYTAKYSDFLMYKSHLDDNNIEFPKPEMDVAKLLTLDFSSYPACFKYMPAAHLALQLQTVNDGVKTVNKGDNLTDDIFRSTVLGSHALLDEKIRDTYLKGTKKNGKSGLVALGGGFTGGGKLGALGSLSTGSYGRT